MRVSFNGARRNLARAFNGFAQLETLDKLDDIERRRLHEIRSNIFGFLCMYKEGDEDCKEMDYPLNEVIKEEEENI